MIKVETFYDGDFEANTYLLINERNEALIIDPANSPKTLFNFCTDLKVVGILLTHGHIDHFLRINEVYNEYKCNIYLHKNAYTKLLDNEVSCANGFNVSFKLDVPSDKFIFIDEGNLQIEHFDFKVLKLFGHTNCSLGYLFDEDKMIFSGDSVFINTIGRYDLATGNFMAFPQTIKKIKALPDDYILYPGHDREIVKGLLYKQNPFMRLNH